MTAHAPCQVCANFGARPYTGEHTRQGGCIMNSAAHAPGPQIYTLGDIRHGTGWAAGVQFVEYTPLIAAAPELLKALVDVAVTVRGDGLCWCQLHPAPDTHESYCLQARNLYKELEG
jgi:hypothetical protein